ncbi:MAG: TerB family tellurite resistance protein [Oscillospiraceae bacterium]|nr:TerB family tellurite resistance protein [Oscillospiraceae bacterium]
MKDLDISAESFQLKFDKFLMGCEAIANATLWDEDTYGAMEDYYAELLVSILLRTITADGWVSDREVAYLNKLFGFDYDSGELEQVYDSCAEMLGNENFDRELTDGITRLRESSTRLADAFVDLIELVCEIIVRSDGFVTEEEKEEVAHVRSVVNAVKL